MTLAVGQDENDPPAKDQFKATKVYSQLKSHLESSLGNSLGGQQSGHEIVSAVEKYILDHKESFNVSLPCRECALRLVKQLSKEGCIQPIVRAEGRPVVFAQNRRTFYRWGRPEEMKGIIISAASSPAPSRDQSREWEGVSRKGSFSRIFSPLLRRNSEKRSSCRKEKNEMNDESSEIDLHEEARLFESALSHLLTLIDIPQIEDVVGMSGMDEKEPRAMSLLSSIIAKMGKFVVGEENGVIAERDTRTLLRIHSKAKMVPDYFNAALCICPHLILKEDTSLDDHKQVTQWAMYCLNEVSHRLDRLTDGGSSPLIPREFSPCLICCLPLKGDRLRQALAYLCSMIPRRLRHHLFHSLSFLRHSRSTNLVFSLCGQSCHMKSSFMEDENLSHAINALCPFILPTHGLNTLETREIVREMVDGYTLISTIPSQLADECRRSSPVPVQFCQPEKGSSTDHQLALLLSQLLNDGRRTEKEKMQQLQLFQLHHPQAYNIFINM